MSNKRKKYFRPFKQGKFDALCGIYSLINADKIVNRRSNSRELYQSIIEYLHSQNKLVSALIEGTFFRTDIKPIINKFFIDRWEYEFAYSGVKTPALREYWDSMQNFLNEEEGRAIIISLSGKHDHWTVIHKISGKRLDLHDSSGLDHLLRLNCTTGEAAGSRHHVLLPAQTVFISRKKKLSSDS